MPIIRKVKQPDITLTVHLGLWPRLVNLLKRRPKTDLAKLAKSLPEYDGHKLGVVSMRFNPITKEWGVSAAYYRDNFSFFNQSWEDALHIPRFYHTGKGMSELEAVLDLTKRIDQEIAKNDSRRANQDSVSNES